MCHLARGSKKGYQCSTVIGLFLKCICFEADAVAQQAELLLAVPAVVQVPNASTSDQLLVNAHRKLAEDGPRAWAPASI